MQARREHDRAQYPLRLEPSVMHDLRRIARHDGTSLNAAIGTALRRYVAARADELVDEMCERTGLFE